MREPKSVRFLASGEIAVAREVFKDRLPYGEIVISDGLGGGDRPFTAPTSMPIVVPAMKGAPPRLDGENFLVKEGKYVIHAGNGYHGMSKLKADRELLIHELTHVWQGEHSSSWSWTYAISSAIAQTLSDDAYAYDINNLRPWTDYNPEQQAQIVEDWYVGGMIEYDPGKLIGDKRFYYIKKHIRGEDVAYDWTLRVVRPIGAGTFRGKLGYPPTVDSLFLAILETPVRANDNSAIALRSQKLEAFCREREPWAARELISRLEIVRPGDALSKSFHHRLATPTRQKLLHILRTQAAA